MKIICIFLFSLCTFTGTGQGKEDFFSLDAQWKPTTLRSGVYLIRRHEVAGGNWQWDYYHAKGSMIKSETFLDKQGTMLNGLVCIYNIAGNLDSVGYYDHGKKQGIFFKLRSYSEDDIRFIRRYEYHQDSLENIVELLSQTPVLNEKSTDSIIGNRYPGGIKKWKNYLANEVKYPVRAKENKISGEVRINFIVDENGEVRIAYILKSKEYSLDQESIRVVRDSKKWLSFNNAGPQSNIFISQRFDYDIN